MKVTNSFTLEKSQPLEAGLSLEQLAAVSHVEN